MQRGYVWMPKQVEELLKDVYDSFIHDESHYFIGGMVLAKEENEERLLVIDGQQRLTTLMLILSSARDVFRTNPDTFDLAQFYGGRLASMRLDKTRKPKRTYLLDFQGEDNEVFNKILDGTLQTDGKQKKTASTRNLLQAKEAIDAFVKEYLSDTNDLTHYMGYLLGNVHVVQTTAADDSKAFTIFEKLNGSGSKLQPHDLLKNLLLQRVDTRDGQFFGAKWQDFLRQLTDGKGGYVVEISSFLKHYIMSQGENVNKTDIYRWFKKNIPNDAESAKKRLADLNSSAEAYCSYIKGEGDNSVKAMRLLGFRQGFVVLLGSRNLPHGERSKIAKAVETVAFAYIVTGAKTNALEDAFCKIASLARQAEKDEDRAEKVQEVLDRLKKLSDEKKEEVQSALMRFSIKQRSDKNKALYILLKLANAIDGSNDTDYTVEHILPQNTDEATGKRHLVPVLGNLTLLKRSVNSSLQDKAFSEKRGAYKAASWLTRSLVEELKMGTVDTLYDKAIFAFSYQRPADGEDWTEGHIKARTEALTNLAMHVWFS